VLPASEGGARGRYRAGHFDIYTGPEFDRVVADQLAFLDRHVPVGRDDAVRKAVSAAC
jgi:hypothetical protein